MLDDSSPEYGQEDIDQYRSRLRPSFMPINISPALMGHHGTLANVLVGLAVCPAG